MKTTGKLWAEFGQWIEAGKNEEVGSMTGMFEVDGLNYIAIKTDENEFALFGEDDFTPICTVTIGQYEE